MVDLKDIHPELNSALLELVTAKTEYNNDMANSGSTRKLANIKEASNKIINILGLSELAGGKRTEFLENDRNLEFNNGIGIIKHYSDTVKISFIPERNGHRESAHFHVKREGGNISFEGGEVLAALKKFSDKCATAFAESREQDPASLNQLGDVINGLEKKLNTGTSTAKISTLVAATISASKLETAARLKGSQR